MKQLITALFVVGAVMLLTGAVVYVTGWALSPYIYTVGATLVALAQINSPSPCKSPNVKRLRRQQIFGALLLVLTGAFMLFTHGNVERFTVSRSPPSRAYHSGVKPFRSMLAASSSGSSSRQGASSTVPLEIGRAHV